MAQTLESIIRDVQAWISAGNFMVMGYPPHDHDWIVDDGIVMTNPPIQHRRCSRCHLIQECRGGSHFWTFDVHENIGKLVQRLQSLKLETPS